MAKLSEKYETMVVYSLKNGEEQVEVLKQKFTRLIESSATLVGINEWGKRRLAYPINYETDGFYVLYNFDAAPEFIKEFERNLNITESVIRFLTVLRKDGATKPALDEKPQKAVEETIKPEPNAIEATEEKEEKDDEQG
ncbi:MAG: 30S ribosomal protein S6 [Oscillospiraceae bacterium]|nr:30S ribosomal protein S6 [Oscillospiraceae bacterium]